MVSSKVVSKFLAHETDENLRSNSEHGKHKMTDAEILPRHFHSYHQSRLLIGVHQRGDGCDDISGGCEWKMHNIS